jgi:hypothetical protein
LRHPVYDHLPAITFEPLVLREPFQSMTGHTTIFENLPALPVR